MPLISDCDASGIDVTAREVTNYHFGYPTYIARVSKKYPFDDYRFVDTGGSIYQEERPCPKCHFSRTARGHDPCNANLPGVRGACCGHGRVDFELGKSSGRYSKCIVSKWPHLPPQIKRCRSKTSTMSKGMRFR